MQGNRGNHTCAGCTKKYAISFCCCTQPPLLFCDSCVGSHLTKYSAYHETFPIEAMNFYQAPGYRESLRKRQHFQEKAINSLRSNLQAIEGWGQNMLQTADYMIAQLTTFRTTVETEITALLSTVQADIEAGIQIFKEKFYELEDVFQNPITKALWEHESGNIELLSCQTNFEEMRKSFDGFLFSIDLYLQTELEDYELPAIIKSSSDIDIGRKVNVYQRLNVDLYTVKSRATLQRFGEFYLPKNTAYTRKRGPIALDNNVYTGEWNQENQQHGFGTYQWKEGHIYTGEWKNGEMSGKGRRITSAGNMHEGEYLSNKYYGFGRCFWPSGSTYTGEFVNNLYQGIGLYYNKKKSSLPKFYIGEFSKNQRCGHGALFGTDGPIYVGEFKGDKKHGKGILYKNGQCIVEELVEGDMKVEKGKKRKKVEKVMRGKKAMRGKKRQKYEENDEGEGIEESDESEESEGSEESDESERIEESEESEESERIEESEESEESERIEESEENEYSEGSEQSYEEQ